MTSRPTTLDFVIERTAKHRRRPATTQQQEMGEGSEGRLGNGGKREETNTETKQRIMAERGKTIRQKRP